MFIDEKYAAPIREWVLNKENRDRFFVVPHKDMKGNVSGLPHSEFENKFLLKYKFPYLEMFKVYQSILKNFNLPRTQPLDNEFGALISYSEKEHEVQPHTDPNPKGKIHTRFNVLISKPEKGGQAIIDDKVVETKENELWVCAAGKYTHSSVKVEGDKPRILLSFGTYLTEDVLNNILKNS
jgi:hypothetical protein